MTQDIFVLNLQQKIPQRLEKQHSIRQERRECFEDDNDAVYAELKRQLGNQTPAEPAPGGLTPIDTHIGSLGGFENSQNHSRETETSMDLRQTSIDWGELTFLDSEPDNSEGAIDSEMSNRLSLSLKESQSGGEGQRRWGNWRQAASRMVQIPGKVLKRRQGSEWSAEDWLRLARPG